MFQVIWQDDAARELEELFFDADADIRGQISSSLFEIESALSQIPFEIGESRNHPNDRLAFLGCIAVRYDVVKSDVRIHGIKYLTNR